MNRKFSTLIERVITDQEILARIYPDPKDMKANSQPNWNYPFQYGYLLLKEVDCGDFFVRKGQNVAKELAELKQQHEQKVPISFKDIHGKKSHSYICYYGSERKCHEIMEEIKKDLGEILHPCNARKIKKEDNSNENQNPVETIDLTESSTAERTAKESESKMPGTSIRILPGSLKIDYIYKTVGTISKDIICFREQLTDLTNSHATLVEIMKRNSFDKSVIEAKSSPERYQKPDKLVEAELTAQFYKIITKKRGSAEWCQRIRSISIPDVSSEQNKNIKELLIYGSIVVGSFMRSLAKELFGEERLLTTILGDHGEFLKGIKQADRAQIFPVEDELKLIKILKLIDAEFFTSRDVYKFLVREKINSYGRDLKKTPQTKHISTKVRSHNITSYFKKISKPDLGENSEPQHGNERTCQETMPGSSGLAAKFEGKRLLVDYNLSSQSSNDD